MGMSQGGRATVWNLQDVKSKPKRGSHEGNHDRLRP